MPLYPKRKENVHICENNVSKKKKKIYINMYFKMSIDTLTELVNKKNKKTNTLAVPASLLWVLTNRNYVACTSKYTEISNKPHQNKTDFPI